MSHKIGTLAEVKECIYQKNLPLALKARQAREIDKKCLAGYGEKPLGLHDPDL